MTLADAQRAITTDWLGIWTRMNEAGDDGDKE
jgi:hypothetical protein